MGDTADPVEAVVVLAEGLRRLREEAGLSLRDLARTAHYSHTTLGSAAKGETLPSLEVTLAYVAGCGADPEGWRERWSAAHRAEVAARWTPDRVPSPHPPQPVADDADPDDAGLAAQARTVAARRVTITGQRRIIGQVELRHAPGGHAAWGRFKGYRGLDFLALSGRTVIVEVGVVRREPDPLTTVFRHEYAFDVHWSSLLVAPGRFHATVSIWLDGDLAARGETGAHELA